MSILFRLVAITQSNGVTTVELAQIGPGDFFGELALVAIQKRNATARALEDCKALKLRTATILDLCHRDLEQFTILQMNLGREIARRLGSANEALFNEHCRRISSAPSSST